MVGKIRLKTSVAFIARFLKNVYLCMLIAVSLSVKTSLKYQ